MLIITSALPAQQIPLEKNCDTIFFNKLDAETYLIENASCEMNGPYNFFYFTSYKEFSDYYNNSKYPLNTTCLSQFNNFDFKKYNMVLINYNAESSTSEFIDIDIKFRKDKYHILIKHFRNNNSVSSMLPGYFDKCISLPKEKSINKPIIYTCNIH